MKKMLTTLMVLALALAAGTAMAGDMNWSFYGKLHTSINVINDSENSAFGLSSNTSRFGFKGDQQLNDTFTFIWQFESFINVAQKGSDTLANRNSFLGVKGDWGTALWGIHDTPFKTLGRKTTFFFDSIADNRQVMMHTDDRTDDYFMYFSPDFSGFNFQVGYEFDQNDPAADEAANSYAVMASYAKDEFFFGGAFETLTKGFYGEYPDELGGGVNPDPQSETRIRFAAKYMGEQFALCASYQMLQDYMGVTDWKSTTLGGEALYHANENVDIKGGYYILDPNTEELGGGTDMGCSLLVAGVDYNFTKNVQFYLQYAGIMNKDFGTFGLGDYNGFGAPTEVAVDEFGDPLMGENVSGFSFGTSIKF